MSIELILIVFFIVVATTLIYFHLIAFILTHKDRKIELPKFELKKVKKPIKVEIDQNFVDFDDLVREEFSPVVEIHDIDIPMEIQLLDDMDN